MKLFHRKREGKLSIVVPREVEEQEGLLRKALGGGIGPGV